MRFEPGRTIVRRYVRGRWRTWEQAMRVVRDDADGLLLWQPVGGDFATLVGADGSSPHDVSPDEMHEPRLDVRAWKHFDVLILMPPDTAYSVWWFFRDGVFAGWYVNLESPYARTADGVETVDHVLDIITDEHGRWEWKDEDEFAGRLGHPLYFDAGGAAAIRAEGERLTRLLDARAYPFDDTHTGFRPDPAWPIPRFAAHSPMM
jgi:hypothetical protein